MPNDNMPPLTEAAADQPVPLSSGAADIQRVEILHRFRRCCVGPADQALRSAVLAYLTGSKK